MTKHKHNWIEVDHHYQPLHRRDGNRVKSATPALKTSTARFLARPTGVSTPHLATIYKPTVTGYRGCLQPEQ